MATTKNKPAPTPKKKKAAPTGKATVLNGFDITAPAASVAGGHSIGVQVTESLAFSLSDSYVRAGTGGKGTDAVDALQLEQRGSDDVFARLHEPSQG